MMWIESHLGWWVIRRRWWIILLAIPAMSIAALGGRHIRICNDTRVFFSEQNPDYQALQTLEHTYSKEQSVFFILAPQDGNVFTPQTLAAVSELTEAGWRIPYSARVNSITNFQYIRAEGDDLIVEDLVTDPNTLSGPGLERIRRTGLSEPTILRRLISTKGHVTGVYVSLVTPAESPQALPEVAQHARRTAEDFRARHPGIDVYLTGSVMIDQAFADASRNDLISLVPLAFAAMTLLVGVSLRSFFGTVAAVVVTVLSMVTALGLVGWLGVPLNAISVGAPGLMLTLAIADNIHVLTTMFQLVRRGRSKHEAIAQSLQVNLRAIFLTNVTTVIGFLSMNFSDSPPFRDLGNIVGLGVMIDLLNSVLLLPALMAVLPIRMESGFGRAGQPSIVQWLRGSFRRAAAANGAGRAARSAQPQPVYHPSAWLHYDRLADFVIRRRALLLWLIPVLMLVAGAGMSRLELDDNFLTYFDETFEFRRATDFLIENLSGWDIIEYSLGAGQSAGITDPEYMAAVDRFADWYRRQPKVIYVSTVIDTIKRLNRDMHGGDESYYRIPERRDQAAQYLLFYEMSLPFGQDLNHQIDIDKSATRFTVIFESMSAKELCRVDEVARRWLQANVPEHMAAQGTGLSLAWAHITRRNIRNMLLASFGEILLISCIMVFALRRLKLVAIFLIPNLLPPFLAFGIWGLTVGRVGLALSVILAMTLGIIVDDTIHFFIKYFRARREEGMSPEQAVRHTFETVGSAIAITSLVLVSGFLVLTCSHYRMGSEMGMMCALVVGLALVVDLFLSPALLMKVDRTTSMLKDPRYESTLDGSTYETNCDSIGNGRAGAAGGAGRAFGPEP